MWVLVCHWSRPEAPEAGLAKRDNEYCAQQHKAAHDEREESAGHEVIVRMAPVAEAGWSEFIKDFGIRRGCCPAGPLRRGLADALLADVRQQLWPAGSHRRASEA